MQLPKHDPTNKASIEAAAWHAKHVLLHYTACNDPICVIYRSSHEYRKSFTMWNYCQYCNNKGHYTTTYLVKIHDDQHTESTQLPSQCLQPGLPDWVLQIESLLNLSDNSIGHPATPPQSTTPPETPTLSLNVDYDSSTASEEVDSSPPSPVMKVAPCSHSPEPNYSFDPETLSSYSPVPEAEEHAFRPKIVYCNGPHETT